MQKTFSEIWKPIQGFEGRYEVSDRGHVKSGGVKILRGAISSNKYLVVNLQSLVHCVHTLVLEAFVGPRPAGLVCDHIDGDRFNNCVGNLRWITSAENTRRGRATKLTESQVQDIRKHAQSGVPQKELAKAYGVARITINHIIIERNR